jgi:cytochrome b561
MLPEECAMALLTNTEHRYGFVAITLHWTMAALLIALLMLGLYMVSLPDAGFDVRKINLILIHKQLGILALALAAARMAWRISNPLPALVSTIPDWQKFVARFVHLLFYALMFALPITGWLMSSAAGIPVSFFGLFSLPDYLSYDDYLFKSFIAIHKWLAYGLIFLVLLHAGAALGHHFVLKDETLKKMLPGMWH